MKRPRWLWLLIVGLLCGQLLAADTPTKKPKKSSKKKSSAKANAPRGAEFQGPSSDQPDRLLALWSEGATADWRARAETLYEQAAPVIAELVAAQEAGTLKGKLPAAGKAQLALDQISRLSAWLNLWSEPVTFDLRARQNKLAEQLKPVMVELREKYAGQIKAAEPKFAQRCKKEEAAIQAIRRLLAADKLAEAEQKALAMHYALAVQGVWYWSDKLYTPSVPIDHLVLDVTRAMDIVRDRESLADIEQARQLATPDFAGLVNQAEEAATAIGSQGKYRVGREDLNGPAALAVLLRRWQATHLQAVRGVAMHWVSNARVRGEDKVTAADGDFTKNFPALLARLIAADAAQLALADVPARYQQYLQALAPVVSLADDASLAAPLSKALDELAQKSPPLWAEVQAYRLATSEILRWRDRLAGAQAATARKKSSAAAIKGFKPTIQAPLPGVMRELSGALVGKPAACRDLIGTVATQRATGSLNADGIYFQAPLDARLQAGTAALQQALLVEGKLEPLTLEAAVALGRTERGDLVEVGGPISRLEIAGVAPLCARVDANDWGLVRLDRVPVDLSKLVGATPLQVLEQIRLRVELTPKWYRQPYGFVEVAD